MLRFVSRTALTVALATPSFAFAQSEEPAPGSQSEQLDPTAIIVTAQRRVEDLQDVSIAATVLDADRLEDKGVSRLDDLQFAAPSLSITDQGLTQSVNIRGVGIASGSPAVQNGVATYLDGVFQPPIVTTSSFYDLADVEVLRGPQGTLVGSNSTGGAVLVNTMAPNTRRIEGYAKAGVGNYGFANTEGAINLPLSGDLAVRAAGTFTSRDSYFTDLGALGNKPDRLEEYAGRFGLLWDSGAFRALGRVEWIDKNSGGYAYRPIEGTTFAAVRTDDIREVAYNSPTLNDERAFISSLELRYELADGTTLRSVSGYSNKRINNLYDNDASTIIAQTTDQFVRERQISEEVNIISPDDGAFTWILGGYYQRNDVLVDIDIVNVAPVDPTEVDQTQEKTTWGVFAHTTYQFNEQLKAELGMRYSGFEGESGGTVTIGRGALGFPPDGLVVADLAGNHSDGQLSGKVALNWTPDADNLIYAFAARGYKPGGINSAASEFGPETVWDYEIGWKSTLADGRVRTQFGAFYMDYGAFQFDFLDVTSGQTGITNVANASIMGLEAQLQANFDGLSIDGGIAYVDSNLDEVTLVNTRLLPPGGNLGPQCPTGTASNPPVCFDYSPFLAVAGGGPNLFSPEWSYNVGIQYEARLGPDVTVTPRVNWAYIGPRFTNLLYNSVTDYLAGRGLLSAQLTLTYRDWDIALYGSNLADKEYVSGQSGNNEFYGAPREYGLRVSTRF